MDFNPNFDNKFYFNKYIETLVKYEELFKTHSVLVDQRRKSCKKYNDTRIKNKKVFCKECNKDIYYTSFHNHLKTKKHLHNTDIFNKIQSQIV